VVLLEEVEITFRLYELTPLHCSGQCSKVQGCIIKLTDMVWYDIAQESRWYDFMPDYLVFTIRVRSQQARTKELVTI